MNRLNWTVISASFCTASRPSSAIFVLASIAVAIVVGSSSSSLPARQVAQAQSSLDLAAANLASGDFEGANTQINAAINEPGLDADQYCEALLIRAQCLAESGDLDAAEKDLAEAEMGAPSEVKLLLARAFVLHRKGERAAASKEFARAKRLDSSLKSPW